MFSINGFHKFTELDSYDEGCIGGGSDCYIDCPMTSETISGLKENIAGFIGCTVADLDLDACDDIGRIDCGRTETAYGDEATAGEIAEWKAGKLALYYAVYSCTVVECTPVSVA